MAIPASRQCARTAGSRRGHAAYSAAHCARVLPALTVRAEHVSGPVLARADGFAAGVQFQRFSHRLGDLLLALCGATTADRI